VPSTSQILSQQQQSFTVSSTTRNTNKDDNNHQHPLPVNDHPPALLNATNSQHSICCAECPSQAANILNSTPNTALSHLHF
ncbi:unnamed protein product, partial [Rotaria socialis]